MELLYGHKERWSGMSEAEALLEIAKEIHGLAQAIGSIGWILIFFLLFKNMGGK
jgi:hypothetical protein